ncbi:MAG: hypothetical protein Q8Q92_00090 [bacterium]|nr:hypothetical protein [bacterium]
MNKDYYITLREKYVPQNIRTIFVLESPPTSGKFFYNPIGETTEPLFSAMMKCVIHIKPNTKDTKADGLARFQKAGYLIVDATYTPVNGLSRRQRNKIIERDYPDLLGDLNTLVSKKKSKTKIILVKANICRLLEPKLVADGFNIANAGAVVPFPAYGNQRKFCVEIQKLI